MKKTLLSVLALLGCLSAARAEGYDTNYNHENHPYFGLRLSLDIPCPTVSKGENIGVGYGDYKKGIGGEIGGIYNIPIVADLYIEPGFGLYYDTYKDDSLMISSTEKGDASVRNFGLRVPLMVGYRFDLFPYMSLSVFTGPMLDVGLTSHWRCSYYDEYEDKKVTESISLYKDSIMKRAHRVDCKWMFGAALHLDKCYYVSVGGGVGMVNIYDNTAKLHENLLKFSVGYNF